MSTDTAPDDVAARTGDVLVGLGATLPALLDLYTDLHSHPELSTREHRTAALVAARLRAAGYDVTEGVGGTGVVGLLANGDGPVVLLRADLDALPIAEDTGLPYASTATDVGPDGRPTPVMHACGHDTHITALLATAEALAARRDAWRGTAFLCFQPAEEIAAGAAAMLDDGLFRRFPKPTVALGQHIWPLPAGTVGHNDDLILSAGVNVDIVLHGKGAHGSSPEQSVDPVLMAASLLVRLQAIRSRELGGAVPAVITAGFVHAGTKHNIIPDTAHLGLNVRSRSDDVQADILAAIERIATAEAAGFGAPRPPELTTSARFPITRNDAAIIDRVRAVHRALFGDDAVREVPPAMGSEDFSEYGIPGPDRYDGAPVPYGFWFFGAHDPATVAAAPGDTVRQKLGALPGPHQPNFAPAAEPALRCAIRAFTGAALAYLPPR